MTHTRLPSNSPTHRPITPSTHRLVEHGMVVVDISHVDDEGAGALQRRRAPVVGLDDHSQLLLVVRLVPVKHL